MAASEIPELISLPVIARLYHNFEDAISTIGSSMVILDRKMEKLQLDGECGYCKYPSTTCDPLTGVSDITSFQAKLYVQDLRLSCFPEIVDASEELAVHQRFLRGLAQSSGALFRADGQLLNTLKSSVAMLNAPQDSRPYRALRKARTVEAFCEAVEQLQDFAE